MRHFALAALGLAGAALTGTIVFEMSGDQQFASRGSSQPSVTSPVLASKQPRRATDDTSTWVTAILARPIFEASRRSQVVDTRSSAVSPTKYPRLAGIIITPTSRSAIFASDRGGIPQVVATGTRLDGFVVQSIDANEVVVVGLHGSHTLRPSFDLQKSKLEVADPLAAASQFAQPFAAPAATPVSSSTPSAGIPGLSGRPMGLVANPDQSAMPGGSLADDTPGLPAPDGPRGSQ